MVLQPRLVQELLRQLPPDVRLGQGLLHQIPEVYHLRPVVPQALGKGVVLRLGHLQIGDVVKQKPLQILRHQVFQLLARAVEQDLFQPPDLGGVMDSRFQMGSLLLRSNRWVMLGSQVFPVSCAAEKITKRRPLTKPPGVGIGSFAKPPLMERLKQGNPGCPAGPVNRERRLTRDGDYDKIRQSAAERGICHAQQDGYFEAI